MNRILKIKKPLFQITVLIVLMYGLSACGGGTKTFVDKSADYQSAQSLPPLKKPERQSRVVVEDRGSVADSGPLGTDLQDRPAVNTSANVGDDQVASQKADSQEPVSKETQLAEAVSSDSLTANVIEARPGVSRLHIDAKFDSAWLYLSKQLQSSSVTVFTRNKDAGRVDIGCGQLDDQEQLRKSGGWSVFRRDNKNKVSDYCALQIGERRGVSIVTLLDRQGDEIVGDFSTKTFNQLNNN